MQCEHATSWKRKRISLDLTLIHSQIQKLEFFVSREILTYEIRNTKYARNNLQWIQSVILWKHCKSHYAISPITLLRCTNSCTNTSCTMYNNEIHSVVVLCSVQKTNIVFKRLIIFKHCCLQSLNLVIPLMEKSITKLIN